MTPTATQTRTLTFDSQLIEDFLQTEEILVNPGVTTPMAVFKNPRGDSEALVIAKNYRGNNELYHVYREPLSDSGWNVYGVGAYAAGLAVEDSTIAWVLGTDGQFWRNKAGRWKQDVPTVPGGAPAPVTSFLGAAFAPISVGLDGTVWAINGGGTAYTFDKKSSAWQQAAGVPPLSQAPVGRPGNLWAIEALYNYSYFPIGYNNGTGWQTVPWPATNPIRISVGADDSVWAVDQGGGLYRYSNGQFNQVSGAPPLTSIAVANAESIWATAPEGVSSQLVHYGGKSWSPVAQVPPSNLETPVDGTPQLSTAPDGAAWFVDLHGVAWKYTSAASGWQRQMAPTGMSGHTAGGDVTEVAAGNDSSGPKMLFLQSGSAGLASLTSGGTWLVSGQQGSGCTAAGATNQADALLLYWADGEGTLQVATYESGKLTQNSFPTYKEYKSTKGVLAGAKQIQINAASSEQWLVLAVLGDGLYAQMGSSSDPFRYNSSNTPGLLYPVVPASGPAIPIKSLVGLPWVTQPWNGFYCCVLDENSNIQLVTSIVSSTSPTAFEFISYYNPLTGPKSLISSPVAAVKSTGGVIDLGGNGRIYATDSNGTLWVIRQNPNGATTIGCWNWTNWHPLANNVLHLASGPGAHNTHELFTIGSDTFLNRLSQNTTTLNWNSAQLHKPKGSVTDPVYVSLYETDITVYNQDAVPEPNVNVKVTVTEPVSVWVTGKQYNLEPGQPTVLVTDSFGKISFSTPALSLHTAQLTFDADGFDQPYAAYPPQHAQDKLKNVQGTTLGTAQARKQSIPKPVYAPLASSSGQKNTGNAATAMRDAFQIQTTNKIQPGLPTGASPDGVPLTYEQVRALWEAKSNGFEIVSVTTGAPGSWDSFWDDIAHFFEDVWYGIASGVLAVESVVVTDIEKGAIEVGVTLASVGSAILKFIVKTIDDVAHFIVAAFKWIGAAIVDAIDWLKEFFDWNDIINTKDVSRHFINGLLKNLQNNLDPNSPASAQVLVRAQFQKLVDLFSGSSATQSDIFTMAQTAFGNQSFNDVVSKIPVNPKVGPSVLHPDGVKKTNAANQVKGDYGRRKTDTYSKQGGKLTPSLGSGAPAGSSPYDALVNALTKAGENKNVQNGMENLKNNVGSLRQHKDFFNTALNDFLALVKDIVTALLDLAEDLIVALLDAAGAAVATFLDIFDYQLDIPILSWIYSELTGSPLTLLDLMCLILAIPSTLIYKLIWGGKNLTPPFNDQQTQQLTTGVFLWPQVHNGQVGTLPLPAAPGDLPGNGIACSFLAFLYSFGVAGLDVGTDIGAVAGSGEPGDATFASVFAIVVSVLVMAFTIPFSVLLKSRDQWTTSDILYLSTWAAGLAGILLNVITVILSQVHALAKYIPRRGPIAVTIVGALQLIFGIGAGVCFILLNQGYNAAYTVGSIITPIPSTFKSLILIENPVPIGIEIFLDLVCDIGSGSCTLAEAITDPGAATATA